MYICEQINDDNHVRQNLAKSLIVKLVDNRDIEN